MENKLEDGIRYESPKRKVRSNDIYKGGSIKGRVF